MRVIKEEEPRHKSREIVQIYVLLGYTSTKTVINEAQSTAAEQ